ncbi:Cna B-type domain-containing protein [Weissella diestrammenae]|uniref:Cna B-type domain-containing protein n=1 Tax=Weissella diestrammenae TaxID=1162633 RepID=A0A7G9T5A8_9LACO|nr:collagen binding domain-containing protein [Weissella diestrammenae]MCM0583141.1 Cna B-type domain-containing protein [Weissella diestrammenae]QNN75283.1 Cna B-type domain-containing protein [Weissella diestrammenae]
MFNHKINRYTVTLLAILTVIFGSITQIPKLAHAASDYGDTYITKAELVDENGNPKTDFSQYDSMQANWQFNLPAGTNISAGDTMTVTIPKELTLSNDVNFDIKDAKGNVIGHAVADHTTGKVTITLTDFGAQEAKTSGITGSFKVWVNWNMTEISHETTVHLDWGNAGSTDVNVDTGNTKPDTDEKIAKWGWYDDKDSSIIHWRVRLNYAKVQIDNAIYTDQIGANQELVTGSINAYHVVYAANGVDFTVMNNIPNQSIFEDSSSKFHIDLGSIDDTIVVDYETKIQDGGAANSYENYGELSGDNITTEVTDVYSPEYGGSGQGSTYTKVAGKKIWRDNGNAAKLRPDAITVELHQNGKVIDQQRVSEQTNWQYSFEHLVALDTNGLPYNYTVTEVEVSNYSSQQVGTDFINTLNVVPTTPVQPNTPINTVHQAPAKTIALPQTASQSLKSTAQVLAFVCLFAGLILASGYGVYWLKKKNI